MKRTHWYSGLLVPDSFKMCLKSMKNDQNYAFPWFKPVLAAFLGDFDAAIKLFTETKLGLWVYWRNGMI